MARKSAVHRPQMGVQIPPDEFVQRLHGGDDTHHYEAEQRKLIDLIRKAIPRVGVDEQVLKDLCDLCISVQQQVDDYDPKYWMSVSRYAKREALRLANEHPENDAFMREYYRACFFEAPHNFESYMIYTESGRPFEKQFYAPRRKPLKQVADVLQALEDDEFQFLGISLPPRVGKSSICIFFLSWIIGKRPNSHNAMAGHSGFLADGFYDELLNLTTSQEYRFSEIFPRTRLESKNAEKNELNYNDPDRFATVTCRGIDGTWTGEVDISQDGYLYVDDLVRDRTESLNPRRLETRYQDYLNVLVDRKNDGSKELMVGTRWNVWDPLGRVEEAHKDDPRYHFLKIPALDENDESNFAYPVKGFSTQYYIDMRNRLDKPEWEAKFQQRPFIREGLLFPEAELRFYNGTLPEGDHRVVSACDVAWGSGDSLSMPVGYEYANGDVYIPKWVFSKGTKEVTLPEVTGTIIGENIKQINFEANAGGDMYAQYVSEVLDGIGFRCAVTHSRAPSTMDKMTKIIASSGNIKRKFVFLDPQHQDEEYRAAMQELTTTVQIGKNEHDDAADGLTQLDRSLEGQMMASVEPMRRRF